jgi:hypothetical protein
MNPQSPLDVGILIAALGGLAVGLERQWSGHATGEEARFAGVRTFTLLGMLSGMAGWLWMHQFQALAVILVTRRGRPGCLRLHCSLPPRCRRHDRGRSVGSSRGRRDSRDWPMGSRRWCRRDHHCSAG